jgi:hypothetical protein
MADPIEAFRFPVGIDSDGGELLKERDYEVYVSQLIRQVLLTASTGTVAGPGITAVPWLDCDTMNTPEMRVRVLGAIHCPVPPFEKLSASSWVPRKPG